MPESPEVKVRLTAEDQGVAAAIRQLGTELKTLKTTQDETASSSLNLKAAFQGLLSVIAVDRVLAFGKSILDNAVNIGNMSQKTGIATETISVFHKVAEDTGIATEKVDQGLVRAAKSITLFQGGNVQAAQAMKLLNLTQADFIGLSPDEKIKKVIAALGGMQEGFKKTTAAQLIFSRGGSDMIVIANKLAEEGFPRLEAECKRLGILVGQDLAQSAQVAKESLQDLEDVGKGVATQFEAGLLPALADAGQALGRAIEGGGDGFEQLGHEAGEATKYIVLAFISIGDYIGSALAEIEADFQHVWQDLKNDASATARAIALTFKGEFAAAYDAIRQGEKQHAALEADDAAQKNAIAEQYHSGLASSYAELFPDSGPMAAKDKATRDAIAKFEEQRDSINLQLNQKKITQVEAEQKIKDLMAQQIPLLSKLAQEELDLANQRGHASEIARARASVHMVSSLAGPESAPPDLTGRAGAKAKAPEIADAAAKAQLALALKQQQDLLTVWKAGAAQREEADKEEYEKGTLDLKAYFDRRRAAIQEETAREIAVLKQERDEVQAAADLAGQQAAAKRTAASKASTPQAKQELTGHADRLAAEQLNQLARADELSTRISTMEIESRTKIAALDADEFKADQSNKQKIVEFLKEIDELQHKTVEGSKEEIDAKTAEMRVVLEQAGYDSTHVDQLLAKYTQLKTSAAQFAEQEKSTQQAIAAFEAQRRAIEIQLKDGVITQAASEREITRLIAQQIPLLRQKAQLELQSAQASGDQQRIAQAQQAIQQIQNLGTQTNKLGEIGKQVSGGLAQDFQKFFEAIPRGTRGIVQAFGQMELSVIQSLEKVAGQMLANILVGQALAEGTKLNDAKTAAANVYAQVSAIPVVGWILAPAAAAAAFAAVLAFKEGGLVSGPGGPTGDRIPAMLSAGEYVLKAGAVKSFGAENLEAINAGKLDFSGAGSIAAPGALASSIVRPSELRVPSFDLPEIRGGGSTHQNYNEFNLYHNGPDAREVLEKELVPAIHEALRSGRVRP